MKKAEAPFHKEMHCYVRSIGYDYVQKRGTVQMGDELSNVDMDGTIAVFERIDFNVMKIDTVCGDGKLDTCYRRFEEGKHKWVVV